MRYSPHTLQPAGVSSGCFLTAALPQPPRWQVLSRAPSYLQSHNCHARGCGTETGQGSAWCGPGGVPHPARRPSDSAPAHRNQKGHTWSGMGVHTHVFQKMRRNPGHAFCFSTERACPTLMCGTVYLRSAEMQNFLRLGIPKAQGEPLEGEERHGRLLLKSII